MKSNIEIDGDVKLKPILRRKLPGKMFKRDYSDRNTSKKGKKNLIEFLPHISLKSSKKKVQFNEGRSPYHDN